MHIIQYRTTYSTGLVAIAAGNVRLALRVNEFRNASQGCDIVSLRSNGNTTETEEHTVEIEMRALIEETQTFGTVLAPKQISQGTS